MIPIYPKPSALPPFAAVVVDDDVVDGGGGRGGDVVKKKKIYIFLFEGYAYQFSNNFRSEVYR